jgi:hypothetical protein
MTSMPVCQKAYLVAWEGVGKDTERRYSACLREISQNTSRKKPCKRTLPEALRENVGLIHSLSALAVMISGLNPVMT